MEATQFQIKAFPNVMDLVGIPNAVMAQHLSLYGGYVNSANTLLGLRASRGRMTHGHPLEHGAVDAAIEIRLPYLINGILMHELYFSQLVPGGTPYDPDYGWGPYVEELKALYDIGGPGWAVLGRHEYTGELITYRVQEHQNGQLAGFVPVLVIDAWEHAYSWTSKDKAFDALLENMNWDVVASRL